MGFDPRREPVEDLLRVRPIVAHHGAGDHRRRVAVLPLDFGRRDIEFTVKPGKQGLKPAALLLEGSTPR